MSVETQVASLTTATTSLLSAVAIQKLAVDFSVANFTVVTNRVNNELNLVDNTPDIDKSLSNADVIALGLKVNTSDLATINGQPINTGLNLVIARSRTEIETVSYVNRGLLRTPITSMPSFDDSIIVEGIGLLVFVESVLEPDDDETSFTAINPATLLPYGQWLLSVASPDLNDSWATDERSFRDDYDEDERDRLTKFFTTI